MKESQITIVGGGIGGLTAALALRRHGFRIQVVEQATEYKPVGAGITIQINAMQALQHIGMAESVAAAGNALQRLVLRFSTGKIIFKTDMAPLIEEFGGQFIGIHRAKLQEALACELSPDELKLGFCVQTVTEVDDRLILTAADGAEITSDAVIGADGLHSRVRGHLWGEETLRYSGLTSWRGILDDPEITPREEVGEYWGASSIFGYVPLGDGKLYWFTTQRTEAGGRNDGDPRDALLPIFTKWEGPAKALIEKTEPQAIIRTDIYDRPPRFPWGRGRLTLLGDAAHPMMPNLGQGGCQAIEDGVVLAATLAAAHQVEPAFRDYEKRRHKRTRQIVRSSRMFSSLAHGNNFLMRFVRSRIFPFLPTSVRERQMREIFRFTGH